jgi:iron(III) transport system substrate-binding protein
MLQMRMIRIIIIIPSSILLRSHTMTPPKCSPACATAIRRALGVAVMAGLILPFIHLISITPVQAQTTTSASGQTLNLYSARHYQSDDALYAEFTRQTGIKITQIQASDEALLERLRSEGKASPADVILLADAARLWKAQIEGLFQPAESALLNKVIPPDLRGENLWFGLTTRARMIVFDPNRVKAEQIQTYQDLAKPEFKGMVCVRSASHPYMLSLTGSIVEHQGAEQAEAWAKGLVANLARTPRGGDTDQIKGVASGECAIALTNSYYFVRMLKSANAADRDMAKKLAVVWPNQKTTGTHVNVSGGGIARYAPNKENARRFLEFLASPTAQAQFADANNEWPVVAGIKINNPELESLGKFKADKLPVASIGKSQIAAARVVDRAGWR